MNVAAGSTVKEALVEIRRLRALLAARQPAPVAVIGLACRFPGAPDAAAFWRLLMRGEGAIAAPGGHRAAAHRAALDAVEPALRGALAEGGYLDDIAAFDAGFFGISPREAMLMDPQHRLALETAWTALEDAGQDPSGFAGKALGVFLGISANDYAQNVLGTAGLRDAHALTGGGFSFAAGRIARLLGATGPAIALDTACSSSLVAVHLAARALEAGECAVALAGGVNLICSLAGTAVAARAGMLSPTARCRPFAAGADGFVRAEGVGFVVLKPLPAALAAGDRVLAVLAGTATGQDGPTAGLTVPSPTGQAAVIRRALDAAGVAPDAVAAVETHGTGTRLGDPIEAAGLAEVFGPARAAPLLLGALKGNIGHAESAAGIAGLIKAVLAMQAGVLPPNQDHGAPNPLIGWERLPFAVPRAAMALPAGAAIGVSSFGASGTNAHAVLLPPPARPPREAALPPRGRHLMLLSAKTAEALRDLVARHAEALRGGGAAAADIAFTVNVGRAPLPHRIAVTGRDSAALAAALPAAEATLATAPPRIGFLCPPRGGYPARMHPALPAADGVSAMIAAGRLWQGWGVTPLLVAGWGAGEIAAAALSGRMEPEAAVALGARLPAAARDPAALAALAAEGARLAGRPETVRFLGLGRGEAPEFHALAGLDVVIALGPVPLSLRRRLPLGVALLAPRGEAALLEAVGALWRRGASLDREAFDAPWPRRRVSLPTTPFARTPFWPDAAPPPPSPAAPRATPTGLHALVAEVLGLSPEALDATVPLRDLGLDSMLAAELEERAAALGETLDLAAILGGASLADLSRAAAPPGWLAPLGPSPARPRARLLVIGHAGAGPGALRAWGGAPPADVAVVAAALPGRDARLHEAPPAGLGEAGAALAEALAALPPAPLLILGHSFGAWLGWEVARRLDALGRPPAALLPVAFGPPDRPAPQAALAARLAALPEEITAAELEAALAELGGAPGAPRLTAGGWRGLRADLRMLAAHDPQPVPPLPCRVMAVLAEDDPLHAAPLLEGWSRLAGAGFTLRRIPGDHLAAGAPGAALLRHLRDLIEETCPP